MKVLLLHQHFNTPAKGGAVRSYYLAKALVDRGVEVVVISGHNGKKLIAENVEGIEIHYVPVEYENRFGFYRRGFSFIRYVRQAIRLASGFKKIDVCYAISVPLTVGIAAIRISRKLHIPFVFEVGDLWPDAPIQLGFIKNKILQNSLFLLEKKIYNRAEKIVALSPPIRDAIFRKTTNRNISVVPNMADTAFYLPKPIKASEFIKEHNIEGKFVISYIGAIGFANGLDFLLECARSSQRSGLPIHFFVCGDGAMLPGLKESAKRLQLTNLTFLPFTNREGVKEILENSDANFICYRQAAILETGCPNKYFDGLAAGKLTIVNFGGWIREEVESERCGVFINPNQPSEFTAKVTPFLEQPSMLLQYQKAGRDLAEKKYSRKILSEQFYQLIKDSV